MPGADQELELEIDATTFCKRQLRSGSRHMDLANSLFFTKFMLHVAFIDVYGAQLLLTMEAHSAKLPFMAPPLAILDSQKKLSRDYNGRKEAEKGRPVLALISIALHREAMHLDFQRDTATIT